jgi:hypothetical protein
MLHPKYCVKAANKRKVLNVVRESEKGLTSAEIAQLTNLAQPYTVNLLYILCKRNRLSNAVVESDEKTYILYKNCPSIK